MFVRSTNPKEVTLQNTLQLLARQMRKNPTAAELLLWKRLKNRQLNDVKFRRQHPLFQFIIDFYCHEYKLIIEIDGPIHDFQLAKDHLRDQLFQQKGYTIIRFTNNEILNTIDNVISSIKEYITNHPSPKGGEGVLSEGRRTARVEGRVRC